MTAATTDRNTNSRAGKLRAFPVAAATLIYAGVMVALNAAGLLVMGATSTTLKCVGIATRRADNSAGAASAISCETERGVFGPFANSSAGDLIALADVGSDCYMVDNQTVAKTSGSSTRSVAGQVHDVTADGVYVNFTK